MTQGTDKALHGKISYFGRASMRIEFTGGPVVYIDPYAGTPEDYNIEADLVLASHQHGDHNQVHLVTLKPDGKVFQCPMDIQPGHYFEHGGIEVHVVEAYNTNHHKGECCGFVLKANDTVIYHSGDTSYIEEMTHFSNYGIDYALLCMDGYYNMGPEEALKVTQAIKPTYVVPIHTSKDELFNQENYDAFDFKNKIELKPNQTLEF